MLAELRGAQIGLWAMRVAVGIVYAATSLHPRAAEQAAKPVPTVNVITVDLDLYRKAFPAR